MKKRNVIIGAVISLLVVSIAGMALFLATNKPAKNSQENQNNAHKPKVAVVVSFDCAKASRDDELIICDPDNTTLHEVDLKLAAQYTSILKTLPAERARWLKESQRSWLETRKQCAEPHGIAGAEGCMLNRYRSRIEELAEGVIINPIDDLLPYQITLPEGDKGVFVLEETIVEDSSNDRQERVLQKILFRSGSGEQTLWEGESIEAVAGDDHSLYSLSLSALNGDQLVVDLVEHHWDDTNEVRELIHNYFSWAQNKSFVRQGVIKERNDEDDHDGNHVVLRWVASEDGDSLYATDNYDQKGFYHSGEDPRNQTHRYRFRFDGYPWEELLPAPQQWLNEPDGAARYITLYRGILAEVMPRQIDGNGCIEAEINWAKADEGLRQWMEVADKAWERGVTYKNAPAIMTLLMAGNERPAMNDEQRELLRALDHVRRRLEATGNWSQRLSEVEQTTAGKPDDSGYAMLQTFPEIRVDCSRWYSVNFQKSFDQWLYAFWLRRHIDGTYEVTKQAIAYTLEK